MVWDIEYIPLSFSFMDLELYAEMDRYSASLIVVGNEILNGQIVDTNTSYLARSLRTVGLSLQRITVVPDVVCIIFLELVNK